MRNPLIEGKFFAQNRCLHEKIRFLRAVFKFYTLQVIIAQQKRYWRNILTFFFVGGFQHDCWWFQRIVKSILEWQQFGNFLFTQSWKKAQRASGHLGDCYDFWPAQITIK